MKHFKRTCSVFAVFVLLFSFSVSVTSCKPADNTDIITSPAPSATPAPTAVETPDVTDEAPVVTDEAIPLETDGGASELMDYSAGITNDGYWDGINAYDYIDAFEYTGIEIPFTTYTITDDALQMEINRILDAYKVTEHVTNRAAKSGDSVNIDYVGYVDDVEFMGGSTDGEGVDVDIGGAESIDEFTAQLIGHKPGEEFEIIVTYPENYGTEELNGKSAVFKTVINYITAGILPELTDGFVSTNLASYGCLTVEEFKAAVTETLRVAAISDYIEQYILSIVTYKSLPEHLIKYQEGILIRYYTEYAAQFNMELNDFLDSLLDLNGVDAMLEKNADDITNKAVYSLALQAIAEDLKLNVTDDDIRTCIGITYGSIDLPQYIATYGRPYLAQATLESMVERYLTGSAVLLEA